MFEDDDETKAILDAIISDAKAVVELPHCNPSVSSSCNTEDTEEAVQTRGVAGGGGGGGGDIQQQGIPQHRRVSTVGGSGTLKQLLSSQQEVVHLQVKTIPSSLSLFALY
jgi:hypothetical protein